MPETKKRSIQADVDQNIIEDNCGVFLGCWDHEKTPALILDLEQSVNLVERKCKKLLEELIQYKKYLEITGKPDFHLTILQRKNKKSKNSNFFTGSDPDIAFRKNLINSQKAQQVFEEKFQNRLLNINNALSEAAHKIGLKSNIILFPANDSLRAMKAQTEEGNTWCDVLENFEEQNFFNSKTKSDSLITERNGMSEFSKITKNELKLYQKLSRLSGRRKKKQKKLKGKKRTLFLGRKKKFFYKNCRKGLAKSKTELENFKSTKKQFKKGSKSLSMSEKDKNLFLRDSFSQEKLYEITKMYQSLAEAVVKNSCKSKVEFSEHEPMQESSSALGAAIRKVIPFTPCTSTSRSYNIGLNIQQLHSLSKHRKKTDVRISASEKLNENRGAIVFQESESNSRKRKVRSKYTGSSVPGFLRYHKSTMSQYTNGRKSMIKSESKTAYAVGSKIMVSDCQRTDIFEFGKNNNCSEKASGDGGTCNESCTKLNTEWTKMYNSFLSIFRKYSFLKENISSNNLELVDGELKSLENEIDYSMEKYKHFLRFYSKFLHLNHRLKSLKITCETESFEPVTSCYSDRFENMCRIRPTLITAVKKAFREVQGLQDKIKLLNH